MGNLSTRQGHCGQCQPHETKSELDDVGVDVTDEPISPVGTAYWDEVRKSTSARLSMNRVAFALENADQDDNENENTDGEVLTRHSPSIRSSALTVASGAELLDMEDPENAVSEEVSEYDFNWQKSRAMLAEVHEFVRLSSGNSATQREVFRRSPSRRNMQKINITDTMGVVPSSALQLIINNPGQLQSFYNVNPKPLGEGNFGVVRKGTVKATSAPRAIKAIPKQKMKEQLPNLKREIEILKKVDHPHIVMVYEIFEDESEIHLVMELCSGGHMQAYVKRVGCGLDEAVASAVLRETLQAVFYLHNKCICHRDLKCENLLLTETGRFSSATNCLKVADFGLSCPFLPKEILTARVGTPSHMAPEVVNKRYNKACDLWACGVILFFLLSFSYPFDINTEGAERFRYYLRAKEWAEVTKDGLSLLKGLLCRSVRGRLTAEQALQHKWIRRAAPKVVNVVLTPTMLDSLKSYRSSNRFLRACLSVVASLLGEKETFESRKLFTYLDTNSDGLISISEMAEVVGQEDAEEIFRDKYRSGTKDFAFTEFVAATFDRKVCLSEEVCQTAFATFDKNGDGSISLSELASGRLLGHLTPEELRGTLQDLDKNGDQEIDFMEFMTMMQNA